MIWQVSKSDKALFSKLGTALLRLLLWVDVELGREKFGVDRLGKGGKGLDGAWFGVRVGGGVGVVRLGLAGVKFGNGNFKEFGVIWLLMAFPDMGKLKFGKLGKILFKLALFFKFGKVGKMLANGLIIGVFFKLFSKFLFAWFCFLIRAFC